MRTAAAITIGIVTATAGLTVGCSVNGSDTRPDVSSAAGYPASNSVTSTPSATPSPTPSPVDLRPVVGGWYAGASGLGVADGAFAAWLRQPVTIAGTWADQNEAAQRRLSPLSDEYPDWTGALDLAVGGTVLGSRENYRAAARGAYDERWRAAAKVLAGRRGAAKAPTFVRPFHEMNGYWYRNWAVTKANVKDYRAAHARYVGILRAAMPTVYISWSPNFRDHSGMPIEQWYPGDDVVDCVAPDYYDDIATPGRFTETAWRAEADDVDGNGNPRGPEAWRLFAQRHGKPVCFPETGFKPAGGSTDHPVWLRSFHAWMTEHANASSWRLGEPIPAEAAGKVLYSVYFNVPHDGQIGYTIHGRGANPRSAKVYRSLDWGRQPAPVQLP